MCQLWDATGVACGTLYVYGIVECEMYSAAELRFVVVAGGCVV